MVTEPDIDSAVGTVTILPSEAHPRLAAAERLREYLDRTDWSGLTFRRRQILEAFVQLASTIGYESVSMRRLGEVVGVKAPSIYRHFPDGRDEIVTEAFRWHFYRFATGILESVDATTNADEYWDGLIRAHLERQLQSPENDLWDILMAIDRIDGFLPAETRAEYTEWLGLYEKMFVAAAQELGYPFGNAGQLVKVVVKILDAANSWCGWNGTRRGVEQCVLRATTISRAMLAVDFENDR